VNAPPDAGSDAGRLDATSARDVVSVHDGPVATDAATHADAVIAPDTALPPDAGPVDTGCVVNRISTAVTAQRLAIYGLDLFVAADHLYRYRFENGFSSAPTATDSCTTNSNLIVDIALTEDERVCTADDHSLLSFPSPTLTPATSYGLSPNCVAVRDEWMYFGQDTGTKLGVVQIDNLGTFNQLTTSPALYIQGILVSGSWAHVVGRPYAASAVNYLLYDVTNPSSPVQQADGLFFGETANCQRVAVANDRVFAACGDDGIYCNLFHAQPTADSCGPFPGRVEDLVAGSRAIYAVGSSGLVRIDKNLVRRDFALPSSVATAVVTTANDTYALVAVGPSGVRDQTEIVVIDLACAFP